MLSRLSTCATALLCLGALAPVASAVGPGGGCCLADGTCIDAAPALCAGQGGAYAGDGTACATLVCHAVPYTFSLSPGGTTVAVPRFSDEAGTRTLTKVTLHLDAELRAIVSLTNIAANLFIFDTSVTYDADLTATFGPVGPLVIDVDETLDCGPGVLLAPGESCDFGGPINVFTEGMIMAPPPGDLTPFVGPGTIDADIAATGIFTFQGGVPFTLAVPVHFVTGTATVIYEYVVKIGGCCFDDGSCADLDQAACVTAGGIWQGPDTDCATLPPDACLQPCDGTLLTIELLTDGAGAETTIELVNANTGTVLIAEGPFDDDTMYDFNLCLEGGFCLTFTIRDAGGNGICCGNGAGFYRVLLDGVVACEGGMFGDEESCTIGDACDDCNDNGIPDVVETAPEPSAPLIDGAEDECVDALHVGPGVYAASTLTATGDPNVVTCEGMQGLYDVWYRYRPAWDGAVIVSGAGSPMPVIISMHGVCATGPGGFLTCAVPPDTDLKLEVERKTDYWIRVAGLGTMRGNFTIRIIGPDSAPSLVDCNNNGIPDECECIGDLNGDGTRDIFDVVLIWARLGESCTCPEDIDGNGIIEAEDAIIVLKNRGRCPFPGFPAVAPGLPDGAVQYGLPGRKETPPVLIPDHGYGL